MKDTIIFNDTCEFKNHIAEISSISLECNYECDKTKVSGTFIIEGNYRTHELSINQEAFQYKLPFEYKFLETVKEEATSIEVKDFTYTFENKSLNIEIEYEITSEKCEEEFTSKEEFDRFLVDHEVEIVDLSEDEKNIDQELEEIKTIESEDRKIEDISKDVIIAEPSINIEDSKDSNAVINNINIENVEVKTEDESSHKIEENVTNTIIDNIASREEEYITYHVYVCSDLDSLDSVANKFKISIEAIKNYNNIESISAGVKLIIPSSNE